MSRWKKLVIYTGVVLVLLMVAVVFLAHKSKPKNITYGMSFNTMYARELDLDWQETYDAIIDDLGVRHFRLAAHWPMIEPSKGIYNFSELDYQVRRAEEVHADVVLAVGRRLPRWPECHIPEWAAGMSWEEQKAELREYIKTVVTRYKDSPAVTYWQVENEPYLSLFAYEHCGTLDEDFLHEEVALVRELDGTRPILVTDSGNLGTWLGAYRAGDAFGTSVYVYFWNPELGQFRTVLPPWFYRFKEGLISLFFGHKETMLIELSAEPWLLEPVTDVPLEVQYTRMDLDKFNDILAYAAKTRYQKQYLWGAEWWYWLKLQGHEELWQRGQELFK
ncbi:beta-galactosidase [Candidatus Kaiserbacteria bacterium]|nr:beta-galactosidase [Candidatus Kaiserbacteria bacterium]MCB9812004.1 beta-galactosidase [Candidatus Nomurabacteria bacterium]